MKILENKRWKEHPWSKFENVYDTDINLIHSIANPKATDYTDLLNGDVVHQERVWENIEKEGMQEPLLIIIGYDKQTIRLESGNHRIKVAKDKGYTHLPAAFFVFKESIFNSLNGNHFFDAKEIVNFNKLIKCPYPYQVDPKKIIENNYFI